MGRIASDLLEQAVERIGSVSGVRMDAISLAQDVLLLAYAWPDETEFRAAVDSVCDALTNLVAHKVEGTELKHQFTGWRSFHFQHHRFNGARADARVIYRWDGENLTVRGFGGRHLPSDIYQRLSSAERS